MTTPVSDVIVREDPKAAYRGIEALVAKKRDDIVSTLPSTIDPDHFISVALQAVTRQPRLLECTPLSILKALRDAAELGLEPSGLMGQAYLVPYRRGQTYEAQLLPGYRGLIDLARRSGEVQTIEARVVRQRDDFDFEYGTNQHIRHRPYMNLTGEREPDYENERGELVRGKPLDAGEYVAAFARAVLTSGVETFDVMSIAEVNAIRARSQSANSGPWATDYAEMARKTIAKRLLKYLPLSSTRLQRALEIDSAFEGEVATVSASAPARAALQASVLGAKAASDVHGDAQRPESDDEGEDDSIIESAESDDEGAVFEATRVVGAEPGMDGTCGHLPDPNPLGITKPCHKTPGHSGAHQSDEGTWPA